MNLLNPRTVTQDGSTLEAYDFGAHLARWEVDGTPVLWCSPRARLDGSKAIRGGVPICFPWFGAGPSGDLSPSHGPVRTATWHQSDLRDGEVLAWRLGSEDLAGSPGAEHLPGPFELRYAVSLTDGDRSPTLGLALEVTGTGGEPIRVEAALHTYLGVGDVREVRIEGLDDCDYLDKVTGTREHQAGPVTLVDEIDRVYDRGEPVVVTDVAGRRAITLEPTGATQTVVWNPGPQKSAGIEDLGPDGWREFVCVETAATGDRALVVEPGRTVRIFCAISARSADLGVTR